MCLAIFQPYGADVSFSSVNIFCFFPLQTTSMPITVPDISRDERCCDGTLGFATSNAEYTIVCSEMLCCNKSETVAVVPVDISLGFTFRCMVSISWTDDQ